MELASVSIVAEHTHTDIDAAKTDCLADEHTESMLARNLSHLQSELQISEGLVAAADSRSADLKRRAREMQIELASVRDRLGLLDSSDEGVRSVGAFEFASFCGTPMKV